MMGGCDVDGELDSRRGDEASGESGESAIYIIIATPQSEPSGDLTGEYPPKRTGSPDDLECGLEVVEMFVRCPVPWEPSDIISGESTL